VNDKEWSVIKRILILTSFLAAQTAGSVVWANKKGNVEQDAVAETLAQVRNSSKFETERTEAIKEAVGDAKLVVDGAATGERDEVTEEASVAETDREPALSDRQEITEKKEAEIPVLTAKSKEAKAESGHTTRLFLTLAVLTVLFASAAFGLRRWSKRTQSSKSNTKIKILTQHYLGPKKSLAIIQVAGESILIGVTDQNITMIKSLSLLDDEIPSETPKSFTQALNSEETLARDEFDEIALRGLNDIRDSVSKRLKGLREI